jgi:two-component system invasion response regulator UvrY
MIKVLITDDHPFIRIGLRQILEEDERIGMVHEAGNGRELFEKMRKQIYDVILLDISLPGRSGLDLISQIKKIQPDAAVLILSMYTEDLYAMTALKYGASGYLSKTSAPEELLSAIHKVSQGGRYISSALAGKLAENFFGELKTPFHPVLSPRELDVLIFLAAGKTVAEIASELSLSPKTISTYRTRLLTKLNLRTTSELIRYGISLERDTHPKPDNDPNIH